MRRRIHTPFEQISDTVSQEEVDLTCCSKIRVGYRKRRTPALQNTTSKEKRQEIGPDH